MSERAGEDHGDVGGVWTVGLTDAEILTPNVSKNKEVSSDNLWLKQNR